MAGMMQWMVSLWCSMSVAIFVFVGTMLLLPQSLVSKSTFLGRLRGNVQNIVRQVSKMLARSPLTRLALWILRKLTCGTIASKCQQPYSLKVKICGSTDVSLTWSVRLPTNPLHDEQYVCAWSRLSNDGQECEPWTERQVTEEDYDAVGSKECPQKKLRFFLDKLPEHQLLQMRVCAMNGRGRSPWSELVVAKTFARPIDDGLSGPLGVAGRHCGADRLQYRWTQTKTEVSIKIPIASEWKSKDLRVKITPNRLEVLYVGVGSDGGSETLLAGPFPKNVKADETFWEIDESNDLGRHIAMQLVKGGHMEKWACAVEGDEHPLIDVRHVRFYTKDMAMGGAGGGIQMLE